MSEVVGRPAERHRLHTEAMTWRETNCYTDVWIEVLHALGHEPVAMLGPCLRIGLEADQWTFFKPSFDDLFTLYGVEVNETNPWRGLLATCESSVATGRIALPEVDSWFLPDTAGVAYQLAHVKSTIAVLGIDTDKRWLSYAHNAGCFELSGDDFDGVFRRGAHALDDSHLPSYVDMCTPGAPAVRSASHLADLAWGFVQRDLPRLPATNPFVAWAERFADELESVRTSECADAFHAYAFTTFRQFGPAFELASTHLTWIADNASTVLSDADRGALREAAEQFAAIASTALVFQMRTARAVMSGKPLDPTPWSTQLIDAWQAGVDALRTSRAAAA